MCDVFRRENLNEMYVWQNYHSYGFILDPSFA